MDCRLSGVKQLPKPMMTLGGLWDKMDILQTIFSNKFSWMKNYCISIEISLKFISRELTDNKTTDNGLVPNRRQAIIWTNAGLFYWRIYAPLGFNDMMTSSNGNIFRVTGHLCGEFSPVSGEFPAQRPATRSFDVFFDQRPNKRLSKQSWGWWFETHSPPLWRHSNGV